MSLLLVTADYRIPVDQTGAPLWLPLEAVESERFAEVIRGSPLADSPADCAPHEHHAPTFPQFAVRISAAKESEWTEHLAAEWVSVRSCLDSPHVAREVALLRFREEFLYDPKHGTPLDHGGVPAMGHHGHLVFPRIDPAVIGIVELQSEDKILLGRNQERSDYFSLIAGYVEPGETLEAAFQREVLEETGRRCHYVRYVSSQPWPSSGSLMVGFRATTTDVDPVAETDGELTEIRWASATELPQLPLPAPGSIARTMIEHWAQEQLGSAPNNRAPNNRAPSDPKPHSLEQLSSEQHSSAAHNPAQEGTQGT